jgi:hypothetical protein
MATRIKRGVLPPVEIVGVVPDSRDGGASEDPGPTVYLPFAQSAAAKVTFIISTTLATREAESALRSAIRGVDPGRPIDRIAPLQVMLHESLGEERFRTVVLAMMTMLALLIAGVGIYGVTAYLVQQGARDVAIRLALGATGPRILTELLRGTITWILAGALLGIVISWGSGAHFARRFPELAPAGPTVYFAVALVLMIIGTGASAVPSIRASRASPSRAMRGD